MSSINFANLSQERPELEGAWSALSSWLSQHPSVTQIELPRLARETTSITHDELAEALRTLVAHGFVRRVFGVESPNGVLIDDVYDAPTAVPEVLEDRFLNQFQRDDARIVSVFLLDTEDGR